MFRYVQSLSIYRVSQNKTQSNNNSETSYPLQITDKKTTNHGLDTKQCHQIPPAGWPTKSQSPKWKNRSTWWMHVVQTSPFGPQQVLQMHRRTRIVPARCDSWNFHNYGSQSDYLQDSLGSKMFQKNCGRDMYSLVFKIVFYVYFTRDSTPQGCWSPHVQPMRKGGAFFSETSIAVAGHKHLETKPKATERLCFVVPKMIQDSNDLDQNLNQN